MLDLKITGGTVVDGTGAAAHIADVGVRDERIVSIGDIDEEAREEIDASGKIVSPGFVDIHTHYDAQVFWDPDLTPSSVHGVTTVVGGNCGFTIAPLIPDAGEYLMRMLARVEGMPLESLARGVPWNWRSFGEYLDRIDGKLAINAGFLVGHCALRRVVMGEDAVGNEASPPQVDAMAQLLDESLSAGGLGFSSSLSPTHNDGDGNPVPSRFASHDELLAMAEVVGRHEGTTIELLPAVGEFSEEHRELMIAMSRTANRPLNWNVLICNSAIPQLAEAQLAVSDEASARGARIVALTLPQVMTMRTNLRTGFLFDTLPGWAEVIGQPLPERICTFSDAESRKRLDEGAHSEGAGIFSFLANWEYLTIDETFSTENKPFEGKTVGEIAAAQGKSPFDAMLDLAVADELRTSFLTQTFGDDAESWKIRADSWSDPRTIIGASDAGAHLDMIDTFATGTALLGPAVRDRKLMGLEEAVHQLTQAPAELYGIRDRGVLRSGAFADIVVFDADKIGVGPIHTRYDLPGEAGRLYAEADGIEHVLVNGVEIVRGKQLTGKRSGTLMRSGRDTDTVTAA